jgi:hypothetical protein
MNTAFDLASIILAELAKSDAVGPPPPRWFTQITGGMAHFLMGAVVAWFHAPRALVLAFALALFLKEVALDLAGAGYRVAVVADSAVDLVLVALGWWIVTRRLKALNARQRP